MKKNLLSLFVCLAAFMVSGCTSDLMRPSEQKPSATVAGDRARIVFIRSTMISAAVGVEILEVTNGDFKFIGQLPTGNRILYETTPGEKVFMAYGMAADFMRANLAAGKTYYSIVRPNWGTGGFAPTPVRADGTTDYNTKSPDFAGWISNTTLIEPNEKAHAWMQENKQRYQEIYSDYWSRWMRKTDDEKAQRTLRPEDGM